MEQVTAQAKTFGEAAKHLRAVQLETPESFSDETDGARYTFAVEFKERLELALIVGERYRIRLILAGDNNNDDVIESTWATAFRTKHCGLSSSTGTSKFLEFTIPKGGPDWEAQSWQEFIDEPISIDAFLSGHPMHSQSKFFTVDLAFSPSLVTYEAELATLKKAAQIWASDHPAKAVLDTLVLLKKPTQIVDLGTSLYNHLPLTQDWNGLYAANPPTKAEMVLRSYNTDQRQALKLMRKLPNGLAFVPGCPGSGKTHWALSNVALAQSGTNKAQTLYLLDINHTVDDAADRMVRIYKGWGIKRRVIRMFTWSKVTKETKKFAQEALPEVLPGGTEAAVDETKSGTASSDDDDLPDADKDEEITDFRKTFAHEAVVRKVLGRVRNEEKAPTLDEAVWEYYQEHADNLADITTQLAGFLEPDKDGNKKEELDHSIVAPLWRLYRRVLREADFIATTPFAAQTYLQFLKPDLIVFDEAGHAREVSTLMSVVYFQPKAWIFVGDYRQIRPYVAHQDKEDDSHPLLFCMSAMERLALNGLAHRGLLQNHRAFANLERLPSNLFYGRQMMPDPSKTLPVPVQRLQRFLDRKRGKPSFVPRLVVDIVDGKHELKGKSSWNPFNVQWVGNCIAGLLQQNLPERIDKTGQGPITGQGTILVVSPYKAAVDAYESMIEARFPGRGNTITARTLNTAQGLEADVVIVDLVRGTKFVEDPRRLCVALTRARQAEIIMMSQRTMNRHPLLRDMWAMSREVGQTLSIRSPTGFMDAAR
ncbi:P-loop containing nucleoside triphosphate hydrolase protein [Plectosphaerella plurivora]|uniref:P-loop containing nucleoside triphosphate hydrolase protein n=1 Tax=Plectosphaerella plurivora TaxID=936078 RepID=A0A9P8V9B7_9PEZI|nr:P-loop containing nucleoside triphosphate hydrolase protein [Plectosphaerella plurivora]